MILFAKIQLNIAAILERLLWCPGRKVGAFGLQAAPAMRAHSAAYREYI
jgi:hypothetical protein